MMWWGNIRDSNETVLVSLAMAIVTMVYTAFSYYVIPDYHHNWYEFVGTWLGLTCVWLTRTRNIQSWPIGIISVLAFGFFFQEINLFGQQWLNWGFFLPISFYCWWQWKQDYVDDLPITRLSPLRFLLMCAAIGLIALILSYNIQVFVPSSQYPSLDALVVVSSMVAQYLLAKRKIESWFLWLGPVNACSIVLFWLAGAYVATLLYAAFFIHAAIAIVEWQTRVSNELSKEVR
jgi:nicotinamide mononucleotide transporter